jgi:CheY-like chemotaxis protein
VGELMLPAKPPVVLIVEDEPLVRLLAVDFIEDAGFDVIEATSAAEAIEILERRLDIRIVFTDVDMPGGIDGMKLAAAVRDRWPPIEIIITSGKHRPLAQDMPARGVFFPKPYSWEEVTDMMHRFAG